MHNDPANCVDLWGLADIVIFSAIDLHDNLNDIGYNLLVKDSYSEIIKAADEQGKTVDPIKGKNATLDNLLKAMLDDDTERVIIIAHGDTDGILYDVNGDKININGNTNIAGKNLEIIDVVGCYASQNKESWGDGNQSVRTYNPGSSDPGNASKADQIWWNQTNEAIEQKIPESIRNNGIDTSGDPNVSPSFEKRFFGDYSNAEGDENAKKNK